MANRRSITHNHSYGGRHSQNWNFFDRDRYGPAPKVPVGKVAVEPEIVHSHIFNSIHIAGPTRLGASEAPAANETSEVPAPGETSLDAYESFDHHCPIKSHVEIQRSLRSPATTFSFVYDPRTRKEPTTSNPPDSQSVQKWIDETIANATEKLPEGVTSVHFLLINKQKWDEASSSFTDFQSVSLGL
jgi:hypothetical protein